MGAGRKPRPPRRSGGTGGGHRHAGAERRDVRRGEPRTGGHRRPRAQSGGEASSPYEAVHLADDIVGELKATTRPGKGEILVKVFAEAAAAFASGDYAEAIRLAEQAKHMALRSAAARELLGLAYYRAEKWKEATRELAAFRRIAGTTEQNPVIADCYRAMSRPDKALELIDEMDPRTVAPDVLYEGQIVAAGALADERRVDEAIRRLEALDLNPGVAQEHHLRAWYMLGDLLERRGRFTQARDLFAAVAAADAELTDAPERASRLSQRPT